MTARRLRPAKPTLILDNAVVDLGNFVISKKYFHNAICQSRPQSFVPAFKGFSDPVFQIVVGHPATLEDQAHLLTRGRFRRAAAYLGNYGDFADKGWLAPP